MAKTLDGARWRGAGDQRRSKDDGAEAGDTPAVSCSITQDTGSKRRAHLKTTRSSAGAWCSAACNSLASLFAQKEPQVMIPCQPWLVWPQRSKNSISWTAHVSRGHKHHQK